MTRRFTRRRSEWEGQDAVKGNAKGATPMYAAPPRYAAGKVGPDEDDLMLVNALKPRLDEGLSAKN